MSPWQAPRLGAPRVVVITGLPASGKTTYARDHMERGDLIVDMDALYAALSGLELRDKPEGLLPFVAAARDAVLDRLRRPANIKTAWVLTTDAAVAQTLRARYHAKLVVCVIDEDERRERLAARGSEAARR